MLQLRYTRKNDESQYVTVLGDPDGIRDLYWQLTSNYKAQDGTEIANIRVFDMFGRDYTDSVMTCPHSRQAPTNIGN